MKATEFSFWFAPAKPRRTRYRMTVQEAQQRFPRCTPDPGSREMYMLPETATTGVEVGKSMHAAATKKPF